MKYKEEPIRKLTDRDSVDLDRAHGVNDLVPVKGKPKKTKKEA